MYVLQIVGEAATKLSPEICEKYPQIGWQEVIGMRHRLVHAYVDIDPDIVWQTVKEDAPRLLAQVRAILNLG